MPHWIAFGLLTLTMAAAAVTDCRTGRVYNTLTYPAILSGFILWSASGYLHAGLPGLRDELLRSLLGFTAGFVPFAVIFAAGGLGGGDVKLMGAVGAISASPSCVLGTALYALIVAAVFALFIMVRRGIVKQTLGRIFGALLAMPARVKTALPTDSPRVPFALAVCIGGLIAGTEHLIGLRMPWGGV